MNIQPRPGPAPLFAHAGGVWSRVHLDRQQTGQRQVQNPTGAIPAPPEPGGCSGHREVQGVAAMAESHGWWKLTFLRKRQAAPTVLYESPDSFGTGTGAGASQEGPGPEGPPGLAARLEKLVDKSSKGKHVKVSNSGRFKEKKKVRATLAEHPNLCGGGGEQEEK
ncbi:proline-rich protein 15-like protein [Lathamus discolor]|uniref:proline-rich protein 15-like protein n=1 Tax=Lathamus discolor TaxID=678569 RepID=UPI0032B7CF1F